MMRFFSILIIVASCSYIGFRYWRDHPAEIRALLQPVIAAVTGQATAPASTPQEGETSEGAGDPPMPPVERGHRSAPPGVFYMLERVKVTKDSGVLALAPGEEVRLMQRLPKGRMRVTSGHSDFEVKQSQVTQDYDLALALRHNPGIAETLKR